MAGKTVNQTTAVKGSEVWSWASKEQEEAWKYGPKPLCLSGGYGSGKTMVACRKILRLMDAFPGYRVVVARRRWVHLVKTTMATFFKVCKPEMYSEGRRSDSEKILRLNNGSELIWMHLEDGEEVANIIPGLEINALFIDQAEEVDEELYDKLSSRLGRWDRAVVPDAIVKAHESLGKTWKWFNQMGQIIPPAYNIIACNPDHEGHWIYRRFHPDSEEHWEKKIPEYDGAPPKPTGNYLSYHDLGYKMITMASTSNKYLTKQNISALLVNDESFLKRYVRGEWGSPEGTIHIIHPSSIIPGSQEIVDHLVRTCRLIRTMDYGDSAPTAVAWTAADQEGNVIIYREYYQPNRMISDHRRAITELSKDSNGFPEQYTFNLADPSIFSTMPTAKGGRFCVADEFKDVKSDPSTALFWNPADNNELGTRNRINEYLRIDPKHRNPFTREFGAPRLYFIRKTSEYPNGCNMIIKQLRNQRRVRLGTDMGKPTFTDERDEKVTDHGYDVIRYMIASRPPAPVEAALAADPMSFSQVRLRALRFHRKRKVA